MKLRLAWPPPWDLTASALISILTLVVIQLSFLSTQGFIAPLGLILVILIPGYLFVLSLFPGRSDLGSRRRALLSLGFAALLAALASLVLAFTPRGLQPASLTTVLSLLALFLSAFAYARSSELPSRKRFTLWSKRGSRSGRKFARASRAVPKGQIVSLFFVLLIGALATVAFTLNANQSSSSEKEYTEFDVYWPKGTEYEAASLPTGSRVTALAKIFNHEKDSVNYILRLTYNNTSLFSENMMLSRNQSWEGPVSGILNGSLGRQRLDFLLFKEGNLSTPYRQDQLWINLTEAKSDDSMNFSKINESSDLNASEKKPPVTLEQNTKVVVLGIGDDSGGSASTMAGIKPSSSQTDQDSEIDKVSKAAKNEETLANPKVSLSASLAGEKVDDNPVEILDGNGPGEDTKISASSDTDRLSVSTTGSPEPSKDEDVDRNSGDNKGMNSPKEADIPESTPETEKSVPSSSGTAAIAGATNSGPSQKDNPPKASGIAQEIDSWVSTRGMGSSETSQRSYASGNIRYIKGSTGERAVLGRSGENSVQTRKSRSKKPVRLG